MGIITEAKPTEVEQLRKRLERERRARHQTELIAEQGMHALYQKQAELQLLRSIAVAASEAHSVREVMQTAVDQIFKYTGWPVGHVGALNRDGSGTLVSLGVWHLKNSERFATLREVSKKTPMPPGVGLPGRVLVTAKPAWIVDIHEDRNFP